MKLTAVLCLGKGKFVKGIPGNIWIGKHRFVPPVTRKDRLEMWKRLMYEEEVMMYLSNPYITEEQENRYFERNPDKIPRQNMDLFDPTPPPPEPLKPLEDKSIGFHLDKLNMSRTWKE